MSDCEKISYLFTSLLHLKFRSACIWNTAMQSGCLSCSQLAVLIVTLSLRVSEAQIYVLIFSTFLSLLNKWERKMRKGWQLVLHVPLLISSGLNRKDCLLLWKWFKQISCCFKLVWLIFISQNALVYIFNYNEWGLEP